MKQRFSTLLATCLLAAQALHVQASNIPIRATAASSPSTAPPPVITQVVGGDNDGTYILGRTISIHVYFLNPVKVAGGMPQLTLETGTVDRTANYIGGSGTSTLTFLYTVQEGDQSADLDYLSTTALQLNNATIRDAADDSDANLTLPAPGTPGSLAYSRNYKVDGSVPQVTSVNVPNDDTYGGAIWDLYFNVNYSEPVIVNTTNGTPRLAINIGGHTRYADYSIGSGSSVIVFKYTIAEGEEDTDGITIGALNLNSGTMRDASGNNADLTLNNVAPTAGVKVDRVKPTATISSTVGTSGTITTSSPIPFTVTFSENINGFAIGDIQVSNGTKGNFSGSGGSYTFTVVPYADGPVTIDIPAGAGWDAGYNPNTAATTFSLNYQQNLPVVLYSFSATKDGQAARLQWQTSSEAGSKGFELHRAGTDGKFSRLAEIDGKGNTATGHSYSHLDKNPLRGQNYYRLVQVDLDGKATELGERDIDFSLSGNKISLYPNPATDKVTLNFAPGSYQQLALIGIDGRVLLQQALARQQQQIELDLSAYPKGSYLIRLTGKESSVQKLVKH